MRVLKTDEAYIFDEQKEVFRVLFKDIDLTKITFVGGVADYLNLREYYDLPLHDIDIAYKDEADLQKVIDLIGVKRYYSKFYEFDQPKVLVTNYLINNKPVHIDFFNKRFTHNSIAKSMLLGQEVRHASFETMKQFHNTQISKLTSEALGNNYEWKRLYKHSKKASLYNLITYQKNKIEKELAYE